MNAGWRITMRCAWGKHDGLKTKRECLYRRELDIETLVATRGRDLRCGGGPRSRPALGESVYGQEF